MNILILGWYYSSNLGDAVICDCVATQLREDYPGAHVVIRDLCGRTGFPERQPVTLEELIRQRKRHRLRITATKLGWDKQLFHETWCIRQDAHRIRGITDGDWDLAVFAGGQIFMDDLILYARSAVQTLDRRGIPVIFNGCGTGPSYSKSLRCMLSETLHSPNVKGVTCRDGAQLLDRWCGGKIAQPTDDPALWADHVYGVTKAADANIVGLGVMFPRSLNPERVVSFWRRTIRALEEAEIPWKIFTNGSEGDMTFARKILEGREDHLCPPPETPEALVKQIAAFRSLISFRLHSHIIAASLGIPTVAITWDQKVPRFFEKLGYPQRCLNIKAKPRQVLACLADAEKTGVDRKTVEARRENARKLLTSLIRE